MRILVGVISALGTIYMFFVLAIENFAYQAGAISSDEWNYRCLIMLMCGIITWLSFSGEKSADNDTESVKSQNICKNALTTTT